MITIRKIPTKRYWEHARVGAGQLHFSSLGAPLFESAEVSALNRKLPLSLPGKQSLGHARFIVLDVQLPQLSSPTME